LSHIAFCHLCYSIHFRFIVFHSCWKHCSDTIDIVILRISSYRWGCLCRWSLAKHYLIRYLVCTCFNWSSILRATFICVCSCKYSVFKVYGLYDSCMPCACSCIHYEISSYLWHWRYADRINNRYFTFKSISHSWSIWEICFIIVVCDHSTLDIVSFESSR